VGAAAVLVGASAGLGSGALALLGSAALAIPLFLTPAVGTLVALALRPIIDCFWNQRVIELGSQSLNFQSVIGAIVPAVAWVVVLRDGDLRTPRPIEVALLAYVAISFAGILISPAALPAVADFSRLALPVVFYWIGRRVGWGSRHLHAAAWVFASYGLVPLVGAALQLLGMIQPATGAIESPLDVMRVTGFYHHPLDTTMRAGIGLPFALALACSYTTPVQRSAMALWGAVLAVTSWVPLVRSALVATLVEVCGFLWFVGRGGVAVGLVLIAAAGALIVPPTRAVIFEAIRPLSTGSYYELATGRGVLFAAQVIAFQRATTVQKIVGRGLHSTPGINRQFAPMLLEDSGSPELNEGNVGAHNQYLRVLTESGIVGLLVFAAVLALSVRDCLRAAFRSTRTIDRTVGIAVLLLLLAMCLYGLSGTPLDLPSIAWPTWFAVGMASGIVARQTRSPAEVV